MKTKEFTQRDIDRIDGVHRAVYDCICTVIGKTSEEVPFDQPTIESVTNNIIASLLVSGVTNNVYYPHLVYDTINSCHIERYYNTDDINCY